MLQRSVLERGMAWATKSIQRRVPGASAPNPFTTGPFAPIRTETTATELRVTGTLPTELSGLYARIGPNPLDVTNASLHHWFVGDGMVHGVRLRDGAAQWYRSRYINTSSVAQKLGRPPAPGRRHGVNDAVNTNVVRMGGRLWAPTEAGVNPVELSDELETLRHSFFASDLARSYTAHPHEDPVSHESHAICYDALSKNRVQHVVIDDECRVTRIEEIPVSDGPMMHDCALTASSLVILDLPVTFSNREFLTGGSFPYRWNPAHEARVGLLPRTGSAAEIRWFSVDPCYVFHTSNAFDLEGGGVVLDVVVHPQMFDRSRQGIDSERTTFERWTLDPETRTVKRVAIDDARQEFPRYDERRSMRPHRYNYTVGLKPQTGGEPLLRHDMTTGQTIAHDYGPHRVGAEAVFVPRHADAAEDDGWLISFVYDLAEERSDLVVLNAADVGGEPQAVVHLPVRVPLGFHGNWMPDAG